MNTRIATLVFVAGAVLNGGTQLEKHAPISVCELLESRFKYDGEMVEVRGIEDAGDEGSALLGENCAKTIVEQGLTFPNAINLAYHLDITSPHYDTADFIVDTPQIDKVATQVERLRRRYPHAKIAVTYRGLFETRRTLVGHNLGGGLSRVGFGHLGGCPGQLVIQTAKDPRVQTAKK